MSQAVVTAIHGVAEGAKGIASGALEGLTETLLEPVNLPAKLKMLELLFHYVKDTVTSALKYMAFLRPAVDGSFVNYDASQLAEMLWHCAYATTVVSSIVSDDAGEIVMEAFQEAFSNAIQYGLGGAIATQIAYRIGCAPPTNFEDAPGVQLFDMVTKANMDLLAGLNIYSTTYHEMVRFANEVIDDVTRFRIYNDLLKLFSHFSVPQLYMLREAGREVERSLLYLVDQYRFKMTALIRRVIDIIDSARGTLSSYLAGIIDPTKYYLSLEDGRIELCEIAITAEEWSNVILDVINIDSIIPFEDLQKLATIIDALEKTIDDYWMQKFKSRAKYLQVVKAVRQPYAPAEIGWMYVSQKHFTDSKPKKVIIYSKGTAEEKEEWSTSATIEVVETPNLVNGLIGTVRIKITNKDASKPLYCRIKVVSPFHADWATPVLMVDPGASKELTVWAGIDPDVECGRQYNVTFELWTVRPSFQKIAETTTTVTVACLDDQLGVWAPP